MVKDSMNNILNVMYASSQSSYSTHLSVSYRNIADSIIHSSSLYISFVCYLPLILSFTHPRNIGHTTIIWAWCMTIARTNGFQ